LIGRKVTDKTEQVNKNKTTKSGELINIEQKLTAKFATRVELNGDEQNGVISIRYFSNDELDRIYTLLLTNEVIQLKTILWLKYSLFMSRKQGLFSM
jgi:hypothetical protein